MTVAGWAREVTLVEPEGVDRATVPVGVTLTAAELVDKPVLDVVLSVDDADTVALLVTVEALELDPELVGEAVPLDDTLPVTLDVGLLLDVLLDDTLDVGLPLDVLLDDTLPVTLDVVLPLDVLLDDSVLV